MPEKTAAQRAERLLSAREPTNGILPIEMSDSMRGAFEGVIEHQVRKLAGDGTRAPLFAPPEWIAAAMGAWLVLGVVLFAPPAALRANVPHPFIPPAELRPASLRFGLWLARHKVDAFTKAKGRLPSFAAEAGVTDSAIILEATGEHSYRLTAKLGEEQLELTNRMDADSFLGESAATLTASRPYQQAGTPGVTTAR